MNIIVERKGYEVILISWDHPGVVKLYKQNNDGSAPMLIAENNVGLHVDIDEHLYDNNPLYYVEQDHEQSTKTRVDSQGDNYQYHIADNYRWQLKTLPRGFRVNVYIKTESSDYCPECYNQILKKRIKTVCGTCDGSGMLNAIRGPLPIHMGVIQRKKDNVYDDIKEREEETMHAWIGNVPYVKKGDIVGFDGLLYVIQNVPSYIYSPSEETNKPFLVRQEFVLVRLDKNNELYGKLPT